MKANTAVLLVNLGTPSQTSIKAIRIFLREFLQDHRVIDLPGPLRWLLVNCIIVPFRSFKTAHATKEYGLITVHLYLFIHAIYNKDLTNI
jgi:protoheme ferro-lyase